YWIDSRGSQSVAYSYSRTSSFNKKVNRRTIMIKLFADFNNADSLGRVRLNSQGSLEDIKRKAIQLHDGLTVQLYSDDDVDVLGNPHELTVAGVLSYSTEEKCWVAAIDW